MYALKHKPSGRLLGYNNLRDDVVFTLDERQPTFVHRDEIVMRLALSGSHAAGEHDLNATIPIFHYGYDKIEPKDCEVVPLIPKVHFESSTDAVRHWELENPDQ